MNLSTGKKLMNLENRFVVVKVDSGEGVGWTGNLGFLDTHYYIWSG